MYTTLLASLLLSLPTAPAELPKPADLDIQGIYRAEGDDDAVVIIEKVKSVYIFNFAFAKGDAARGIAIRDGRLISLSWRTTSGTQGITRYEI